MKVLLVCEGSSDVALLSHIQKLIAQHTYIEPDGASWHQGRRLADKIRDGMQRIGAFDLLFVHRDANSAGAAARYREIAAAVQDVGYAGPWVGIVPVRMTEAWLLLDEAAIRRAAGNPLGVNPIDRLLPGRLEHIYDPKAALETALLQARANQGRRRRKDRQEFPRLRRQLLQNLPPGGLLERVPSWTRFRDDTIAAVQAVERQAPAHTGRITE